VKKLIGLLVIVNVAVFLWPTKSSEPAHVHPRKVDVSAGLIRLNKEIETQYRDEQRDKAEAALSGADGVAARDSVLSSEVQCYRLGPFSLKSNYEIAQATLLNAGLQVKSSIRAVSRTEVYRVYIGPFADRAQAIDARRSLSNKGVLDHFIRNELDGSTTVSLGIFSTEGSAMAGLEGLSARVDGVKFREEVVTLPESYWLYFALAENTGVREDLDLVDWGEVGAQIGSFECRADDN
jgi:hypothetical protein